MRYDLYNLLLVPTLGLRFLLYIVKRLSALTSLTRLISVLGLFEFFWLLGFLFRRRLISSRLLLGNNGLLYFLFR